MNADDAEAAIAAVRLALAFRKRFESDVVIDLVGYRRHGHNEQDEAAYTQPLMAAEIAEHATVREQFAARLVEEGVVTQEEADGLAKQAEQSMREAHERLKALFEQLESGTPVPDGSIPLEARAEVDTAVPADILRVLNAELITAPEDFTVHPKLWKQLERRVTALEEGGIDWGQAESLAFASLLVEGIPIRLTGQDTERGTFSHRHMVLHDAQTGATWTPIQNLRDATASMEVHNSPLSEVAALGFEYGYAVAAPESLVLWEAQFGDFVNGAQTIVDQFIVSGLSKWGQTSRLTLLLPHGYEGNGPEHSSARLERFLQLAAQENIRIANPTTAAQYFHLMRRQALEPSGRQLIVMTPKGLLRLKQASSTLADLAEGSFQQVIDDAEADREKVRRLVMCSGKVYYDIVGHEARAAATTVAVARLEQLYPFPVSAATRLFAGYPHLEQVVWAQEEPQNMGAYRAIRHRLEEALPKGVQLRYAGRPVARVAERGLSHRAHPRAGPDRPGGAGTGLVSSVRAPVRERRRRRQVGASALLRAALLRAVHDLGRVARAVLDGGVQDLAALLLRQAAPDVERGQREPDGPARRVSSRKGVATTLILPGERTLQARSCSGLLTPTTDLERPCSGGTTRRNGSRLACASSRPSASACARRSPASGRCSPRRTTPISSSA